MIRKSNIYIDTEESLKREIKQLEIYLNKLKKLGISNYELNDMERKIQLRMDKLRRIKKRKKSHNKDKEEVKKLPNLTNNEKDLSPIDLAMIEKIGYNHFCGFIDKETETKQIQKVLDEA